LLIATTEGGETPYVIGATEEAARTSHRQPFFLYCNSRDILVTQVERSKRVLENAAIHSVCLEVGPMALTGSTRMQASTVLMLAVGLAFEYGRDVARAGRELNKWIEFLAATQDAALKTFIESESATYVAGEHTIYAAEDLAITVFTDTTERAPTFNLAPFDSPLYPAEKHSLTYIAIPSAPDAKSGWRRLLNREPRPLEWPEIHAKTSMSYLMSFDFGQGAIEFRRKLIKGTHHLFNIERKSQQLSFRFRDIETDFALSAQNDLFDHLTAKMLLNRHSTLVMGRLQRFEGNLMTWVYPSNGKLVDRAARYTQILLAQRGITDFTYEEIVRAQFDSKAGLSPKESIVHKTIEKLLSARNRRPESHVPR
jgi:N-acetylmuramic acid 6-phosphate etherase